MLSPFCFLRKMGCSQAVMTPKAGNVYSLALSGDLCLSLVSIMRQEHVVQNPTDTSCVT